MHLRCAFIAILGSAVSLLICLTAHRKACQPMAADRTCRHAVRSLTMASVRTGAPRKLAEALMAASLISMAVHASAM